MSCSWDPSNNLKLWNATDFSEIRNFEGHTNSVNAIILLNETTMASGSTDGTILLWDIFDSNEPPKIISIGNSVESLIKIEGDLIYGGLDNGSLIKVNLTNKSFESLTFSHSNKVTDLEYLNDKKLLASASYDNYLFIINLLDDTLLYKSTNNTKLLSLKYASNILVSGDWDGWIYFWNTTNTTNTTAWQMTTLKGHNEPIFSLLNDSVNHTLYSGSWDRTINVWNISNISNIGKPVDTISTTSIIYSIIFI